MDSKKCFKCGEVKRLSAFYKHNGMADGRLGKCVECAKADVRENRARRIDYYREYDNGRAMRQDRVDARNRYQKTATGKLSIRRSKNKWAESNTVKRAAHILLRKAILDGRIVNPGACQNCGKVCRTHGHHDDYAMPLDVRWLCPACHRVWHKEHGEAKNG